MREAMKEFPGDKLKTVEKLAKKRKPVKRENFWVVKAEVRGCRVGAELITDNNRDKIYGKQSCKGNAKYIEWKRDCDCLCEGKCTN